jgi:hypothetical protein
MLNPGRQIDETLAGKYYSQWAKLRKVRQYVRSSQIYAIRIGEESSAQQLDRILFLINEK